MSILFLTAPPRLASPRPVRLAIARRPGLVFVETSSLSGHNVESPFTLCARGILDLISRGIAHPESHGSGISHGDRRHHRTGSAAESAVTGGGLSRFSFADVVQSGGGVSRGAAKGLRDMRGAAVQQRNSASQGIIKVKDALGLKSKDEGGCC